MFKKIAKALAVVCFVMLVNKNIWFVLAGYTVIAVALQTLINAGVINAPKLNAFLAKIKLLKENGDKVVIRTPLSFVKKVVGWIMSDYLFNKKVSRAAERFFEEAKASYEGEDEE